VAVFFAATVIGKMSSFIVSPISGVVLSYISNKKEKITLKLFWLINLGILIFSSIASVFTLIISKFVLVLLYPELYLDASKIILIANFAVILLASCSLTQTIILRYCNINFQITIQTIYGLIYIFGAIVMIRVSDLKGFCIAALLAALFKFFFIFIIGTLSLRDSKQFIAQISLFKK
jgi:O-antigen/teichoic acid export membrane protein